MGIKLMGKEKFVPLMMQLTRLWVKVVFVSSTMLLATSSLLSFSFQELSQIYAVVGWIGIAANYFVVVPKALKAGAKSHGQRKGDNNKDLKDFAIDGGGKSETTLAPNCCSVCSRHGAWIWN